MYIYSYKLNAVDHIGRINQLQVLGLEISNDITQCLCHFLLQKGKAPKDDFVNDSSGPENEPKRKRKAGGDDGDGKRKKRRTKHKSKYVSVFILCWFSVN